MSSLADRYLRALLSRPPGPRSKDGKSFWRRYWASLTGATLSSPANKEASARLQAVQKPAQNPTAIASQPSASSGTEVWATPAWTDEDEGLLRALKVKSYLRENGRLQNLSVASPLSLEPGERFLAATMARLWGQKTRSALDDKTYFRARVSFAKDPLTAPFMWIVTLPFNLLSWVISSITYANMASKLNVEVQGYLVVTDRALVQSVNGRGEWRFSWSQFSAVDVSYTPPGIRFQWRDDSYLVYVPAVDRLAFTLMMRYLALGDNGDNFAVPDGFIDRVRALGKL